MKREIDPLPAKRNGGLVRIEVDDLEEWYDRNFIWEDFNAQQRICY